MAEQQSAEFDAIVLGAGISGLVTASLLLDHGAASVLVVDEYDHVGGNHLDAHIGDYTFDVGSLIFQDDSPLLTHFPELLDGYTEIDPSWSRINRQGAVCDYPFSVRDDVLRAGPVEWLRIAGSVAWARLRLREQHSARDFAHYWIGPYFAKRSGLEHYMERFCGLPADRIDLAFARQRMGWLPGQARLGVQLRALLRRMRRVQEPRRRNRQLARPKAGFAALYAPAVERLEARGAQFRLGAESLHVESTASGFTVRAGELVASAPRVLSTIPLSLALAAIGAPRIPLPTVTLTSLYFSFAGTRGFDSSILYNFSHEGAWKRLTMYSDFYGRAGGREYFGVEVVSPHGPVDADLAMQEFRSHTRRNGLFIGDLALEGSHALTNAYPIYSDGSGERAAEAIQVLRDFGIESFGRQGGFQYQPTARTSTLEAEAALDAAEQRAAAAASAESEAPSEQPEAVA